jgi:hypothetical protein
MTDLPPNLPPPGPSPLPGSPPLGTSPAGSSRRHLGRPLVITAVVALVVGAGAGVAMAVTGSASPSPSASSPPSSSSAPTPPPGHALRPGIGGRVFGPGAGSFGAFGAVHGQFVVPKQGGGYQTIDTQRGQVTAVSNSAITIKSPDGFVQTYAVTSSTIVAAQRDGIGSIKVGDQAAVRATVSGSTATAVIIGDLSNLQGLRQWFFQHRKPLAPSPG